MTFSHAERRRAREQHPYGLSAACDGQRQQDFQMVNKLRAGSYWEHLQQVRPDESVWRLQESGFGREGGLQGLAPLTAAGLNAKRFTKSGRIGFSFMRATETSRRISR